MGDIFLVSSAGKKHVFDRKYLNFIKDSVINEIIENFDDSEDNNINLMFSDDTTEKLINMCNYYFECGCPEVSKKIPKCRLEYGDDYENHNTCCKSDIIHYFEGADTLCSYIDNMSIEDLKTVAELANFLGIEPILRLCCIKIAIIFKYKED